MFAELTSSSGEDTLATAVTVPTTEGVVTTVIVALPLPAIGPRSHEAECAPTVQLPWLGVAEPIATESVNTSSTWTALACAGPRFETVTRYVTAAPGMAGSGESVCEIARSAPAAPMAASASTRPQP